MIYDFFDSLKDMVVPEANCFEDNYKLYTEEFLPHIKDYSNQRYNVSNKMYFNLSNNVRLVVSYKDRRRLFVSFSYEGKSIFVNLDLQLQVVVCCLIRKPNHSYAIDFRYEVDNLPEVLRKFVIRNIDFFSSGTMFLEDK